MAFESKLEVYKLILQSDKAPTFYKLFSDNIVDEESYVFTESFRKFINKIDIGEYHKNTIKKKGFTAYDTAKTESSSQSITPHKEKFVIEGYIEGGKFGKKRHKSNIDKKEDKEEMDEKVIILDKYYFMLYTPPSSKTAIVMIHSYSSDSISDIFLAFLKSFYSNEQKGYKKSKTERFFPKNIIDDFNANSSIKSFSFTTNMVVGLLDDNEIGTDTHEFTVKVEAKADKNINKGYLEKWLATIGNSMISIGKNKKPLSNFKKGKVTIQDNRTGKPTSFEVSRKFEIKPVIYLDSSKVTLNSDGTPDFDSLEKYCFNLLKSIIPEVYPMHGRK